MHRPTVLLIDDDQVQLKLARIRLLDGGFDTLTANTSEVAFARADAKVPDVIVSDVLMDNDLDGFAVCRKFREDPRFVHVPVILLSAHYQDPPDQELARRIGAFALIGRTPDYDLELATIRRALASRSLPAPTTDGVALYEAHVRTTSNKLTQLVGQVRSAEQRYRALFETARDGIALMSSDGLILEINERWHEMIGIPCEELLGRHITEFVAPGSEALAMEALGRAVAGTEMRAQSVLRHRDGRDLWVEFTASTLEINGETVVMTIGRDVTAMTEAARSLAAAEERYRSLVERLPEAVWTMRADTETLTFVTKNVLDLTGYPAEHHLAETTEGRIARTHPDDAVRVSNAMRGFLDGGEPFDVEYRSLRPDGSWRWLRNRCTARYQREGVLYLDGMLSDITERKQLEQSLSQAQKMEAIGQLTGGIAHDFNNVLCAILSSAEFLMDELPHGDPRREDAVAIEMSARRAASLTRQLLAFSRRQVLAPRVLTLDGTILGLEKMLRRLIYENIELVVDVHAADAPVQVDENQLEQVVMNLVVNARDAMPGGGKVVIESTGIVLDETAGAQVDIPPGHYARLTVRDTGCGMDAETKRRIFEPFFTTKPLGQGTGLGLSTCYGIVKQSGGFFHVESHAGVGTTMAVYLPCCEHVRSAEPTLIDTNELRGKETVLVIEGDERIRGVMRRVLASRGYRVHTAMTSEEALRIARTIPVIDVVLSEVTLPDMSGPATVRALRSERPNVRALYMSGHTGEVSFDKNDTHFIQKPFTQDEIARKLREVLA